jgi:hypothetical protein
MSRHPPVYSEWRWLSSKWLQQRTQLARDDSGAVKAWYLTYATDTKRLAPLQLSADIAGITLTVSSTYIVHGDVNLPSDKFIDLLIMVLLAGGRTWIDF